MRFQIQQPLELTREQVAMLDLHSFLNVINVLANALQLAEMIIDDPEPFADNLHRIDAVKKMLGHPEHLQINPAMIDQFRADMLQAIDRALNEHDWHEDQQKQELEDLRNNVANIFNILDIRVREILARREQPEQWQRFSVEEIRQKLIDVFKAIELNARGRYRIVFDPEQQTDDAYLVIIHIQGTRNQWLLMPPIFQDVIRDLAANARKYSNPGTRIDIQLIENAKELTLTVTDSGKGIPEDQITNVIQFGQRAANVSQAITNGGGFGLTKAYFVTRQFKGRMWIDSTLDQGTGITIILPKP